jgi:hypothetical protein
MLLGRSHCGVGVIPSKAPVCQLKGKDLIFRKVAASIGGMKDKNFGDCKHNGAVYAMCLASGDRRKKDLHCAPSATMGSRWQSVSELSVPFILARVHGFQYGCRSLDKW